MSDKPKGYPTDFTRPIEIECLGGWIPAKVYEVRNDEAAITYTRNGLWCVAITGALTRWTRNCEGKADE